jgi:hypothetical protein
MAPQRPGPFNRQFAKIPSLNPFFSNVVLTSKYTDRGARASDLGSCAGAGVTRRSWALAPPPAGRGLSSSRGGGPSRSGGEVELPHRPSPALSSSLAAPPLSEAPSGRAAAPLAVEGLRSQRRDRPPAPATSAGLHVSPRAPSTSASFQVTVNTSELRNHHQIISLKV